ncbi:MAG: PaaI family thioesterase [Anaerolineae bacterium]|nr:PaaI family thioesterase [Anaerolineae bacterium]
MAESNEHSRTYIWHDPQPYFERGLQMSGLDYMRAIASGEIPMPPIGATLNYRLTEVDAGRAIFEGEPGEFAYNPIGVVHGGYASTLLDSALGCAVHTTLPAGTGYTTVQINVHLVRPITRETGKVRAEAWVVHSGRQVATAEARLTDAQGKLLAHGTTTCAIFPLART